MKSRFLFSRTQRQELSAQERNVPLWMCRVSPCCSHAWLGEDELWSARIALSQLACERGSRLRTFSPFTFPRSAARFSKPLKGRRDAAFLLSGFVAAWKRKRPAPRTGAFRAAVTFLGCLDTGGKAGGKICVSVTHAVLNLDSVRGKETQAVSEESVRFSSLARRGAPARSVGSTGNAAFARVRLRPLLLSVTFR